jgi:hypothetical protein
MDEDPPGTGRGVDNSDASRKNYVTVKGAVAGRKKRLILDKRTLLPKMSNFYHLGVAENWVSDVIGKGIEFQSPVHVVAGCTYV